MNNPLESRYASKKMVSIFDDKNKIKIWRKLWIALAESEMELGLNITNEQIKEMQYNIDNINNDKIFEYEKKFRHDVMANIYAFGDVAPLARKIIHLGATSAFITDNADLILYHEGLEEIFKKGLFLLQNMEKLATQYKNLPTVGYTHFQTAQLTTVGKRIALWMEDIYYDLVDIEDFLLKYKLRGVKGTTGTQASFLSLFNGDNEKVKELDRKVLKKMGFNESFPLTGQTYPRRYDARILTLLSGIGQTLHKVATDLRLLQHELEIFEPSEKEQIGSSAMPYKKNPMRSERICSLARYLISLRENADYTASVQWLERSLDDSANRRITIPHAFLTADAILLLAINIFSSLTINEQQITKNVNKVLPFMITEEILMSSVKKGGDRQQLHETIRKIALKSKENEKYDFWNLLTQTKEFEFLKNQKDKYMNSNLYIGLAPIQVDDFLNEYIHPFLEQNKNSMKILEEDIKV